MDNKTFQISARQRTLIIIASLTVMAYYFNLGLARFQNGEPNAAIENGKILVFTGSYCYILYSLWTYFKFYEFGQMASLTIFVLVGQLIGTSLGIVNSNSDLLPEILTTFVNIGTLILLFIWAYYLTRIDKSLHRERVSLYRHAYSIFITFFFALIIIFNVAYQANLTLFNSQNFLLAIPYIFIIDFALKLNKTAGTQGMAST